MWESLDAVDDAGHRVSEDLAGTAGRLAWVLDGASSVFPERDRVTAEDASDSRWLVEQIAKHLEGLAGEEVPLTAQVAQAIERTAGDARRDCRRKIPEVPPSAALGVVRQVGRSTEYLLLADISIVLRRTGGCIEKTDHRVDLVNEPARVAMGAALEVPGATFATAIQHTRTYLAEARRTGMNKPDGYWVASVDRTATEHAQVGAVDDVEEVLLASDGFMRAVHLFGLCTLDDLFSTPLPEIAAAVRAAEAADPDTRKYPRWSVRDDICAHRLVWHD
jgi:hypothetical protein